MPAKSKPDTETPEVGTVLKVLREDVPATLHQTRDFTYSDGTLGSSFSEHPGTIERLKTFRYGQRTETTYTEGSHKSTPGVNDVNRFHQKGNDPRTLHVPTDAGLVPGSTSTPTQRAALDGMKSTKGVTRVTRVTPN